MKDQTIEPRLLAIIAKQFKISATSITPATSLFKDLARDSLDVVELVLLLEREFNVKISDEDLEKLGRVDDLTDYIQAKISNLPAGGPGPLA